MSVLTSIYSGRIQGQTSGGTAINTVTIDILMDGRIRFTDWAGRVRTLTPAPDLAHLLRTLYVGTGGPVTSGRGPFLGAE